MHHADPTAARHGVLRGQLDELGTGDLAVREGSAGPPTCAGPSRTGWPSCVPAGSPAAAPPAERAAPWARAGRRRSGDRRRAAGEGGVAPRSVGAGPRPVSSIASQTSAKRRYSGRSRAAAGPAPGSRRPRRGRSAPGRPRRRAACRSATCEPRRCGSPGRHRPRARAARRRRSWMTSRSAPATWRARSAIETSSKTSSAASRASMDSTGGVPTRARSMPSAGA